MQEGLIKRCSLPDGIGLSVPSKVSFLKKESWRQSLKENSGFLYWILSETTLASLKLWIYFESEARRYICKGHFVKFNARYIQEYYFDSIELCLSELEILVGLKECIGKIRHLSLYNPQPNHSREVLDLEMIPLTIFTKLRSLKFHGFTITGIHTLPYQLTSLTIEEVVVLEPQMDCHTIKELIVINTDILIICFPHLQRLELHGTCSFEFIACTALEDLKVLKIHDSFDLVGNLNLEHVTFAHISSYDSLEFLCDSHRLRTIILESCCDELVNEMYYINNRFFSESLSIQGLGNEE